MNLSCVAVVSLLEVVVPLLLAWLLFPVVLFDFFFDYFVSEGLAPEDRERTVDGGGR